MPNPQHDQRLNVLAAATKGGWQHDQGVFDDSNRRQVQRQVDARMSRVPWNFGGGPVLVRLLRPRHHRMRV